MVGTDLTLHTKVIITRIPKDIVPQDLSLKSCFDLIKIQDEKGPGTSAKGKRTAKKK